MSSLDVTYLDAESVDEDFAEGDGFSGDRSAMLLPPQYLNPEANHLLLDSIGDILPAEKYSVLLSDFVEENEEPNEECSDYTG